MTLAGHSSQATADSAASDREIVLSRVFDAPRELMFKAWTDSRHVAEWWGPNGFTIRSARFARTYPERCREPRPGGAR